MGYVTRHSRFIKHALRAAAAALVAGYTIVASAATQIPMDRTITSMGSYENIGFIAFTPAIANSENCAYINGDQVIIDWTSSPNAKTMYATALAAYVAGRKIGFGISGCYPGSAPLVYRVDVAQ